MQKSGKFYLHIIHFFNHASYPISFIRRVFFLRSVFSVFRFFIPCTISTRIIPGYMQILLPYNFLFPSYFSFSSIVPCTVFLSSHLSFIYLTCYPFPCPYVFFSACHIPCSHVPCAISLSYFPFTFFLFPFPVFLSCWVSPNPIPFPL